MNQTRIGRDVQVVQTDPGAGVALCRCEPHVDMVKKNFFSIEGPPLVEIQVGQGKLIASEMMLSAGDKDPIAGRLLRNMLAYLNSL